MRTTDYSIIRLVRARVCVCAVGVRVRVRTAVCFGTHDECRGRSQWWQASEHSISRHGRTEAMAAKVRSSMFEFAHTRTAQTRMACHTWNTRCALPGGAGEKDCAGGS